MIPKVKTWIVRVVETGERFEIETITKTLAKIIFRQDYISYWGKEIKISLKRA